MAYPPQIRAEAVAYAEEHGGAAAAAHYKIPRGTILRWKKQAHSRGLNGPQRPQWTRGNKSDESAVPEAVHFDDCPMCLGTGKRSEGTQEGFFMPEGSTVEDVRVIFRIAGVEDLGSANRGRGSGATMRETNQAERTGPAQAKDRRNAEIA